MDLFTHYSAFSAIILGLGVTKLFQNIGRLIEFRKEIKHYALIYVWMLIIFIGQMQYWWAEYINRSMIPSNFVLNLLSTLFPICWFLLIEILIPSQSHESLDLRRYYFENKTFFFALAIITALIAMIRGYFLFNQSIDEPAHLIRVGFISIFIYLAFERVQTEKIRDFVHGLGAFLTLILFLIFIFLYTIHCK